MKAKISPREYGNYEIMHHNNIYGEIDTSDVNRILYECPFVIDKFLDAGSGCGKMILEIGKIKSNLTYLCGIENMEYRHEKAIKLLNNSSFDIQSKTEFICGDFLHYSFHDFDLVYCCNVMFDNDLNQKLIEKILRECNHCFVLYSLEPKCLQYLYKKLKVNTSWMKHVDVFIYCKNT